LGSPQAAIIGAGVGGLASGIRLRLQGYEVDIFEAHDRPGGKVNELRRNGFRFDAGPSLFTLPDQVDELFRLAGRRPEEYFQYEALEVITRYFYPDGTVLNAFRDVEAFATEIEEKTGESRERVLRFLQKSRELYDITSDVFLNRSLHKLSTYIAPETLRAYLKLHKLDAFRTMDQANRAYFQDPRVVQLFNRYATYNGSDPYQAPATLNIIPHLEHNIGAYFPRGGMYAVTESLTRLAGELGVRLHLGSPVREILTERGQVTGLRLDWGSFPAEVVVSNADIVPTYRRLMPSLPAPERTLRQPRSSSALIFYWGINRSFPELDLHNIFFSGDYPGEFRQMWDGHLISHDPTVYLYISSKHHPEDAPPGAENWFVMVNAPSDKGQNWDQLIRQARQDILRKLSTQLGVDIEPHVVSEDILDPRLIESRTSSHQGALYGNSSNNRFAAFLRHPNFSRRVEGLYFAGGSVHPGGGIPLCLLSARIVGDLVEREGVR